MSSKIARRIAPTLLTPFKLRGVTTKNRIVISPMCMYSAKNDGVATELHFAHQAQFAIGGAGMIFTEATGITAQGRISPFDLGLYDDTQIAPLARITTFLHRLGVVAGIQLGHAGRRASSRKGWFTNEPLDATDAEQGYPPWDTIAPSAVANENWPMPRAMSAADIADNIAAWASATKRAVAAGYDAVEIHGGHGYLVHEFLSPLTNQRTDVYGGTLRNRMRFGVEVAQAVRQVLPAGRPLFFRVSAVDGDSWTIEDSVAFARELERVGVDVIDCSSGGIEGLAGGRALARGFGFQVPFADRIRNGAEISTMAVGLIVDAVEANRIVTDGQADLIAIAREALADPHWAHHANHTLQADFSSYPDQYRGWLERRAVTIRRMQAQ